MGMSTSNARISHLASNSNSKLNSRCNSSSSYCIGKINRIKLNLSCYARKNNLTSYYPFKCRVSKVVDLTAIGASVQTSPPISTPSVTSAPPPTSSLPPTSRCCEASDSRPSFPTLPRLPGHPRTKLCCSRSYTCNSSSRNLMLRGVE